ncbi:apolipoprotein D-like [Neocloeon triangulifer]|uniref:apolipoprotein D-like n=1 Tax=Neocloeon triangulifer TaxID=2078957 RepID=UPI00286F0415|nr:apolipoprotein D-like [Neocloeon triangulifer]XP_059481762.1 apolipoprotein D-like [Neocloeon triangulifer]
MKTLHLALFALLALASQVSAQRVALGRCPKVKIMPNFQPALYLGDWYEYKKYFAIFQLGGTCTIAKYTDKGNGVIGVINRQFSSLLSRYNTIMGTAVLKGEHGEAKLGVRFPSAGGFESPYWILDTDYVSYSVVFTCNDFGFFNYQFSWVLTRERFPSEGTIRAADYVLKANGVDLQPFSKTDHKDCP